MAVFFDPDAKYTVTFNVEPTDSVLNWNGKVQTVSADGKYEFADVAVGSYDYSVSNADDYATAEGTVTVKNKNVETTVQLELNKHTLTFALTPKDAELTVKKDNEELKSNSDGSYSVSPRASIPTPPPPSDTSPLTEPSPSPPGIIWRR